jgi:hypothetical protein
MSTAIFFVPGRSGFITGSRDQRPCWLPINAKPCLCESESPPPIKNVAAECKSCTTANPGRMYAKTKRMDLVGKRYGGKLGLSDLSIPCQNLHVRYYNTLMISCCACKQRSKNHKKIIQTIMESTRSSNYVAIGSGGNGLSGSS